MSTTTITTLFFSFRRLQWSAHKYNVLKTIGDGSTSWLMIFTFDFFFLVQRGVESGHDDWSGCGAAMGVRWRRPGGGDVVRPELRGRWSGEVSRVWKMRGE